MSVRSIADGTAYRFRRKANLAKDGFAIQTNRYSSCNVMRWSYNNTTVPATVPPPIHHNVMRTGSGALQISPRAGWTHL